MRRHNWDEQPPNRSEGLPVIQRKVCMLGSESVGKTSLIKRFVHNVFSEKYHSTVGVKIDTKDMAGAGHPVRLVLWDLESSARFAGVRRTYLRGLAGYILVVDATRPDTLEYARSVQLEVEQTHGDVPFVVALNKSDLTDESQVSHDAVQQTLGRSAEIMVTSAKTGVGVEAMFSQLATATEHLA